MNLTQEQEEMDRALKQYLDEEQNRHAHEAQANTAILDAIEITLGKKYRDAVFECIMDSEGFGMYMPVETPKGNRQEEDWGEFDHIYVDQWQNGGMVGDDFAGDIYIPLQATYLKISYQM